MGEEYLQILQNKVTELNTGIVNIYTVPLEVILKLNPQTGVGFFGAIPKENTFEKIDIYIDQDVSNELKLEALLHEYGHAIHYQLLGPEAIAELQKNDHEWLVLSEYEAFFYQLKEIKAISIHLKDLDLLHRSITRLHFRSQNDLPHYKEAIEKLRNTPLWNDCINLISTK